MKKIVYAALAITLLMTACGKVHNFELATPTEQDTVVLSCLSKENCYLCGEHDKEMEPWWGQNNVGIISLNSLEIMPLQINRYDHSGSLIEKCFDTANFRNHAGEDGGFTSTFFEDPDRGFASGSITLNNDELFHVEKASDYLCESCLKYVLDDIFDTSYGVGIINFADRQIRMIEDHTTFFLSGDYCFKFNIRESSKEGESLILDCLVAYCPVRYKEAA